MYRNKTLAPAVATLALVLAFGATPAQAAGKADRARAAIATAEGKIQAGDAAGVGTTLPARQAEARHALNTAKEDLSAGRKEDAIAAANRASAIAEAALGEAQKRKEADAQANAAQAAQAQADAAAAQQQAALSQQQQADAAAKAQQAQASAQLAQQQAADANSRATEAATRAAVAEQQLAAANSTVETQVTTETKPVARSSNRKVVTKVVRKPAPKKVAPSTYAETKTTVTQTVTK